MYYEHSHQLVQIIKIYMYYEDINQLISSNN